jgi:hypothetical protein
MWSGNALMTMTLQQGAYNWNWGEFSVITGFPSDPSTIVMYVDESKRHHTEQPLSGNATSTASRRGDKYVGLFVVGYSAGWVRWFSADGKRQQAHQLHDTRVMQLKEGNNRDELLVLHEGGVLVIVRAQRPKLVYQKYELEGQRVINDIFLTPPCTTQAADPWSIHGTHASDLNTQVLSLGAYPALALYQPSERQGIVSNIASAVFSLAKSWWSSGATTASPTVKGPKEAHIQEYEWGLDDSSRVLRTVSAPCASGVAALTDNLGRVMLLDVHTFSFIRMWKGLRDAQCAFIDNGCYLAIYAPRRGVLEVWRVRHGVREALLSVGVGLVLSSTGHLIRSTGEVQLVRYSPTLAAHWKSDTQTLARIRVAVANGTSAVPLLSEMRHPKLLVQALLALPVHCTSSDMHDAITTALLQCGMTDGADVAATASLDVTHLVWLGRFIHSYRVLEGLQEIPRTNNNDSNNNNNNNNNEINNTDDVDTPSPLSLTCRQFLGCFSVHDGTKAHLARDIAPSQQHTLAHCIFGCGSSAARVYGALQHARVSQSDIESLLANFVLCDVRCAPSEQRIGSLLRAIGRDDVSWDTLRKLVRATEYTQSAVTLCRLLGWKLEEQQLTSLLQLEPPVSIDEAIRGKFSAFTLEDSLLERLFPKHAALFELVAAHACVRACQLPIVSDDTPQWLGSDALNASINPNDDSTVISLNTSFAPLNNNDNGNPTTINDTPLLIEARAQLLRIPSGPLRAALAWWCWQHRVAPVFWRAGYEHKN